MGFSFASVLFSYFLIMGGTWLTAMIAARAGIHGGEAVGYILLAVGGFLGGLVAGRASRGSTIIEPAIGAVLLVLSFVGLGAIASGNTAFLVAGTMKALALTAVSSAVGGVAGAFVAEKLFGHAEGGRGSWVLYVGIGAVGATAVGFIFGGVLGKGEAGPLFGMFALAMLILGGAVGASAPQRPLGAAFLGGFLGVGALLFLAVAVLAGALNKEGLKAGSIPSEVYIGFFIMALLAGVATLIGAAVGWATVGKKHA